MRKKIMNNKYKYFNSDKLCCYIRIGSTMMFKYSLQSGANRIKVYGDKSKECLTNYRSFDNEHLILENILKNITVMNFHIINIWNFKKICERN